MATGLDRLAALQRNPFGMSSSVRAPGANRVAGSAGANYRRQAEDYNTAMRLLRRQARRGDAGSALDAIRLRQDANERGFTPGGIRRKDEFDASAAGAIQAQERGAADRERAAMLLRRQTMEQANDRGPRTEPRTTGATDTPPVNTGPSSGYTTLASPTGGLGVSTAAGGTGVFAPDTTLSRMAGAAPDAQKWWNPGARRSAATPLADTPKEYRPRTAAAPREGMIDGRPASETKARLRALMTGGQPGSAMPAAPPRATEVDVAAEYADARAKYQGGDGAPSSAYQTQYSDRMKALREGATPAEIRRMDAIMATGKDPGAPKATQGRYKGSKPGKVDEYLAEVEKYQKDLDPEMNDRANEVYRSGNSLDQVKMAMALLKRASKINERQNRK